jgi:glycosyltransferase involved in cell wall biosynthesis
MPLVKQLSNAVMFNGRAMADLHLARRSLNLPYFVYYSPVDTARFSPSPERRLVTRRLLGIPNDAAVVGTVANLNPQKGIEYFIRAAVMIQRTREDAWFVIVGASFGTHRAYERDLQHEIARSGIPPNRIILTGGRSDVESYYPVMDVKLITSVPRSEGTTTTAMEAMACGIPVVAADVGAVREVVSDGVTGFVVPPVNARALAKATLQILNDSDLRMRMSVAGRRRAVEHFSAEKCADVHLEAIQAAVSQRQSLGGMRVLASK